MKQPDLYEKHFGHIGVDDESLTAQGRFTLNGICAVTDDLKNGDYTTGIDKIDDVSRRKLQQNSSCSWGSNKKL